MLSLIVPTWRGDEPVHLSASLDSIARQSRVPDEVVIVADGPLHARSDELLEEWASRCSTKVVIERFAANVGPAGARNRGLEVASGSVVAFLDADDICVPHRFERQLEELGKGEVDVVASAMWEFAGSPDNLIGLRRLACTHDEIARYARRHNPINQSTVMARRRLLLEVGGYRDREGLEDYDLWLRLLARGARFVSLPEPLVLFRFDPAIYARRSGWAKARAEISAQRSWVQEGLLTRSEGMRNAAFRAAFRMLPPQLMSRVYQRHLRHQPE